VLHRQRGPDLFNSGRQSEPRVACQVIDTLFHSGISMPKPAIRSVTGIGMTRPPLQQRQSRRLGAQAALRCRGNGCNLLSQTLQRSNRPGELAFHSYRMHLCTCASSRLGKSNARLPSSSQIDCTAHKLFVRHAQLSTLGIVAATHTVLTLPTNARLGTRCQQLLSGGVLHRGCLAQVCLQRIRC
jgi:hypothetical protein